MITKNKMALTEFPGGFELYVVKMYRCGAYLAFVRYLAGFDRRYPIPSSISLLTSLFTRSVILHLITNSLVTCLQGLGDEHYREGPEIPLRQSE